VQRQSAGQITDAVLAWPSGTRIEILAPLVRGRKGEFRELFESARKQGFIRAIVDGEVVELANPPKLNKRQNHDVSIVVDRLVVRSEDRGRLNDSLETALKLADGLVEIVRHDGSKAAPTLFSERYGCATCGISMPELEPRHFSFNSPFGACPACGGLGTRNEVSEELILGDPSLSILEGVICRGEHRTGICDASSCRGSPSSSSSISMRRGTICRSGCGTVSCTASTGKPAASRPRRAVRRKADAADAPTCDVGRHRREHPAPLERDGVRHRPDGARRVHGGKAVQRVRRAAASSPSPSR
jgi:hypothetical protein